VCYIKAKRTRGIFFLPTNKVPIDVNWTPLFPTRVGPKISAKPTKKTKQTKSPHRHQHNPFISYESRPVNLSHTNEENNINDATQFASNRTNNPLVFIASGHKLPPHPNIFFSQFFAHTKHWQPKISSKPKNINTHTHHTRFHHNIYYIYIIEWLQISLLFALNSILFQI